MSNLQDIPEIPDLPEDGEYFTEEQKKAIEESMKAFAFCDHIWVKEPVSSNFYYLCANCGGAQGIRLRGVI